MISVLADQYVVVIGGANIDVKARSADPIVPATSNPGTVCVSAGGVGRNIADNLARLGTRVHLLAAVGRDAIGDRLVSETATAGVVVDSIVRVSAPTGTYMAVLDADGELVTAVSDMAATDSIDVGYVSRHRGLIVAAAFVVLDGNLPSVVISAVLDIASRADVRVLLDPVSDAKATRLAELLTGDRSLFLVTPNRTELCVLTGCSTTDSLNDAVAQLHALGAENVWVRLGVSGSVFSAAGSVSAISVGTVDVVDVTGAGDAATAAFVHAVLRGRSLVDAARFGHAAAGLTIASTHTVRPDLTESLVDAELQRRTT